MTSAEFFNEGERRFGPNKLDWVFVCPACGHRQTPADYRTAGAPDAAIAFSCVGRWIPGAREAFGEGPGPCNYAGGGLFQLNPVELEDRKQRYFAYAEVEP